MLLTRKASSPVVSQSRLSRGVMAQATMDRRTFLKRSGVTAGGAFAFTKINEIAGPALAQAVQLGREYHPKPPVEAG